ncbi:MAG TPA: DNA polymerase III subunit beta [Alphaproteobacteria bacterium]|nr:DNA polymerase III subunit beta [Alphaproteobacteria bacterium]
MNVELNQEELLKALSHGQSVVEKKTTVPILSYVLLNAQAGTLTLTSTDLDISLVETIPAHVIQEGMLTVSAHMLFEVVKKLTPSRPVVLNFDQEQGWMFIQSGKASFKLPTLSVEDYPKLTQTPLPYDLTLFVESLKRLIEKTRFCMAVDETRYLLTGIYLHPIEKDGKLFLRAVATDTHRLACVDILNESISLEMPGIIIGKKTINEIYKLLNDVDAKSGIHLSFSTQRLELSNESFTFTSRLIEGKYPSYERAIPQGNDRPMIVPTQDFMDAVERVAILTTNDKVRALKLSASNDLVTLSALSQDNASGQDELSVSYESEAFETGFNARYLQEFFQQLDNDETQLLFGDPQQPVIIQHLNDPCLQFILMPIKV